MMSAAGVVRGNFQGQCSTMGLGSTPKFLDFIHKPMLLYFAQFSRGAGAGSGSCVRVHM